MNIFIDCGTHLFEGFQEVAEIHKIDSSWRCFAFEADPSSFMDAQDTYASLVGGGLNISFFNKAVWTHDGVVRMNSCLNDNLGSNILADPPTWDSEWNHDFVYKQGDDTVESIDLSQFIRSIASARDFLVIKMDIEGAEFAVLESMILTGACQLVDVLYCEFHERFFADINQYSQLREQYVSSLAKNGVSVNQWI